MKTFSFEKLFAWQEAKELIKMAYQASQTFPKEERFGLTGQLRRATFSVANNLAEGAGRQSPNDKAHFTTMAYGSLMEAVNQSIIAYELGYLEEESYWLIRDKAEEISRMLTSLRDAQLRG